MRIKQPYLNLLNALVIIGGGFILFNGAFMLAALVINSTAGLFGRELGSLLFLGLILLIFGGVAISKFNDTIKATFFTMPLMTILVMIGIWFYQRPLWVPIGVSALVLSLATGFVYFKKLGWQYYFAIVYVAVLGLYIVLMGVEI